MSEGNKVTLEDKIKSKLRAAAHGANYIQEESKHMPLPENIEEWLSKQDIYASTLPSELEEQKRLIKRYIQIISGALKRNDDSTLRRFIYLLLKELDIAHENEGILSRNVRMTKEKAGSSKGGKANKRKEWAENLATQLVDENYKTQQIAWDAIPDSSIPFEIETDHACFNVYKEGAGAGSQEKVIAIETSDISTVSSKRFTSSLNKSTFLKEYYGKAKNSGK